MLFSQRQGITPVKDTIQDESMDQDLRNALSNVFYKFFFREDLTSWFCNNCDYVHRSGLSEEFCHFYWVEYCKKTESTRLDPYHMWIILSDVFDNHEWHEVYDIVELTAKQTRVWGYDNEQKFTDNINCILKKELSAYRFVNNVLVKINSKEEIECIELAMNESGKNLGISEHLKKALEYLANRKNPDYRNSIKESISAVESLCKYITGKKNATLGQALKHIEKEHLLHPDLRTALEKLYIYTNDEKNGIRHAMIDDQANVNYSEAQFMLVCCSAFINYINTKKVKNKMVI